MKTFLDSNVLLAAWKGREAEAAAAEAVMDDPHRKFCTSEMVRLELLPKPLFFKNKIEAEFFGLHFDQCETQAIGPVAGHAFELARRHGLAAADAINLASAIALGADEFVTLEKPGKPMFRVQELRVISLHAAAAK